MRPRPMWASESPSGRVHDPRLGEWFTPVDRAITLTTDMRADVQLPRLPVAVLDMEGSLSGDGPDGSYIFRATGVNTGDGCASSISGTPTLTG
jgi:hypothetical protein